MIKIDRALGFTLTPYWRFNLEQVLPVRSDMVASEALGYLYQDMLGIKWEDEQKFWYFPLDPLISISGKNSIAKRSVLKSDSATRNRRGSIKELWTQDDYEITIAGVFIGDLDKMEGGEYSEKEVMKLRNYCEGRKPLMVDSKLMGLFNIERICVESFEFPFTKGIENQNFTIKASSDDMFDLLIKE
jgi:hypothetical protein